MHKIMLTLLFCSVIATANNKQSNSKEEQDILIKTLQEVKQFKKDKNDEIQRLQLELQLLKKNFNFIKHKKNQEIKKLKKRVKISQNKIIAYKKSQKKVNKVKKQLKETKEIVKDLHVMLKKKQQIEMDEYALGQYYYNH